MKQLNYTFGIPDSRWYAVLPLEEEVKYQLVSQLRKTPREFIKMSGVPSFILMGQRSFEKEMADPGWHTGKKLSGEAVTDSRGSADFTPLLKWHSLPGFIIPLAGTPEVNNPYCMLISETVKNILAKFSLAETQFIPVNVKHERTGETRTYYFLNATTQTWPSLNDKLDWPAMEWTFVKKETSEVIASLKKGDIADAATFWNALKSAQPANISDLMKYESKIPQYIFKAAFDALQLITSYIFTPEVAALLEAETGPGVVVSYTRHTVFSGTGRSGI